MRTIANPHVASDGGALSANVEYALHALTAGITATSTGRARPMQMEAWARNGLKMDTKLTGFSHLGNWPEMT